MKRRLLVGAICAGLLGPLSVACNKQQYSLPEVAQDFAQEVTYNNKVDLLLMVDNSSSMDTYQSRLANQVSGMLSALNGLGMDYRIVVVTSDMRSGGNGGIFVGSPKVLTPTTPNLEAALTSRIRQGTGGSDLERGLQSIRTALEIETGFIREDALLAVISLSNEDDYSSGSVSSFQEFFDQLKPKFKGTTQAWMLNFIGVPHLSSSCSTALDGIYKEPGAKWIALSEYSGGLVQEICDTTLAKAVDNVRKRIVEVLTDFHLGRRPVVESITVRINGQPVPQSSVDGWEYIESGYIIRFHGTAVPGADDRISVDFKPAEAM